MNPRETVARAVDRANVRAVRARLGSHETPNLAAGEIPLTAPGGVPRFVGRRGGREVWAAEEGDWTAERIPAMAPGEPAAAVILLHGWLAGSLQFAFYRWLTSPLGRSVDVWMPRLPEHGERTTPGAVSGEHCLSADPDVTIAQLRRAVAEVGWLARWLREDARKVAVWGVSLGGWVASLAASADNCDALLLWAPVLDPELTLRESGLGAVLMERRARAASVQGRDEHTLDADLQPLSAPLSVCGDRLFVVGGKYDDIATPRTLESVERSSRGRLLILPHGHITLLASRTARSSSLSFLRTHLCHE